MGILRARRQQTRPARQYARHLHKLLLRCLSSTMPALNLLTPERVQAAASSQIKTGVRVQLDWSMENVQFPGFNRNGFKQKIIAKSNATTGWIGCDDEVRLASLPRTKPSSLQLVIKVSYNTQCSSQWDGFRHVGHRQLRRLSIVSYRRLIGCCRDHQALLQPPDARRDRFWGLLEQWHRSLV